MNAFDSIKNLTKAINELGYICDLDITLPIFIAYTLGKPILLEGPAGVGLL